MQQHIVGDNLVENSLRDRYVRSLVFNNHDRLQLLVVKDGVGPESLVAHMQRNLVGKQCGRVVTVLHHEVDEVLSHPLFGSEPDVASSQKIENQRRLLRALQAYVEGR